MKSPNDSRRRLLSFIFLFIQVSFGDSFAFEKRDRTLLSLTIGSRDFDGSTRLWQGKQERSVEGLGSIENSSSTLLVTPSHDILRNGHLNGHRNGHRNGHTIAMGDLKNEQMDEWQARKYEGMSTNEGIPTKRTGANGAASNGTMVSIELRKDSNETMVTPNAHLRFQQFQANVQQQWILLQQDMTAVEKDVFRTQQMLGESQHQLSLSRQRVFQLQGSLTEMERQQSLDQEKIAELQRKLDSKTYRQLLGNFFHVTMIKIRSIVGLRWLLSRNSTSQDSEKNSKTDR